MPCFNYIGCWIIYKTKDGQMHDLEAYELMSANDAPERDPMDWSDQILCDNNITISFYELQ